MTILPITKCGKEESEPPGREEPETPPPPHNNIPMSPSRGYPNSTPSSSTASFYSQPRTPPSPARDREKPFISENWEVERRDGGRRRRRVAGPSRTATPRSPPVENRERCNSDDEYDSVFVYDCQKERKFEQLLKEKKGYIIKRCLDDGACLFRAVADQLYGDQEMHSIVRVKCMDYMLKNRDYFSQFVTEDYMSYINRKRQDNCHGNQLEMQALAEMYNRRIEVFIYSLDPINTLGQQLRSDYAPIRLSYHFNCHYNSVVDPYKPSVGVGLGLPGYKPGLPDQQLLQQGLTQSEADDIERIMMVDKLESSDLDATGDAIQAAIARESYLEWVKQNTAQQNSTATSGFTGERAGCSSEVACASTSALTTSCDDQVPGSSTAGQRSPLRPCSSASGASTPVHHASSTPPHSSNTPPHSSSTPPHSSNTPPHSSSLRTPPHSSSSQPDTSTLYPLYGLDEYDEDKMLEAAMALSRQEYASKMRQ